MEVRYMGTKRHLAPAVVAAVDSLATRGRVADLFSGMGSVGRALNTASYPVLANDISPFVTCVARARFCPGFRRSPTQVLTKLEPDFAMHRDRLRDRFARRLRKEDLAIEGGATALAAWVDSAPHVGRSQAWRAAANEAARAEGSAHYELSTRYFAAAYFSTEQAIALDALRFAIDQADDEMDRDWLLAAWLSTASTVANSPGHTAQFLRPGHHQAFLRIRRQWRRNVWHVYREHLVRFRSMPGSSRKLRNRVSQLSAHDAVHSTAFNDVLTAYADPPYTKDQYSRYYHVLDTLTLYDYPESHGLGRYRDSRFVSPFSRAKEVVGAFEALFSALAQRGVNLVLSYPSDGLASRRTDVRALLDSFFRVRRVISVQCAHSTLGASNGRPRKPAKELLYVCESR